jgi:hypothetical protein
MSQATLWLVVLRSTQFGETTVGDLQHAGHTEQGVRNRQRTERERF